MSAGKTALRLGGKLAAPLTAATAAYDGFNTDTETYAKRFGLEDTQPGLLRDLGVRALGVASDAGNGLTFGLAKKHLYRDDGSSPDNSPTLDKVTGGGGQPPTAGATPAQTYPTANANSNARQLRLGDPSSSDLKDEFSNAMIENRNPGGKVTKVGNSYSGGNVSGEVSFQGADGNALRGRPGGGYTSTSAADGAARLAEARATLRNPDGSTWSANDNAIMAANLRDGVDPYRGTSRAPKGPTVDEQLQQAMAKYADPNRKLGTGKALRTQIEALTQRANNENSNRTTLRGQDMDYEGRRIGAEATHAQTRAQALRDERKDQYAMGKDQRDHALALETHDQNVGTKARENTMKEFEVIGADGKPDLAASKQSFDAVRQIFPGIDSADESTRNKFMADAKEMHGIFQKARTQDKVGWDSAKFWQTKRPNLSGMPDAVGRKDEMVGQLAGLFTVGASGGDTLLQRADGSSVNLGQLNERQRELLARAQKTGWGK